MTLQMPKFSGRFVNINTYDKFLSHQDILQAATLRGRDFKVGVKVTADLARQDVFVTGSPDERKTRPTGQSHVTFYPLEKGEAGEIAVRKADASYVQFLQKSGYHGSNHGNGDYTYLPV